MLRAAALGKEVEAVFRGVLMVCNAQGLIEPVFGHIQQRGLRRFTLRGQTKVDTQWKLHCIVHNAVRLQMYGNLLAA